MEIKKMEAAHAARTLKPNKVKTAWFVFIAFATGFCEGTIPFVIQNGADNHILYYIPFIPIIIYLINRVITDLERWYNK